MIRPRHLILFRLRKRLSARAYGGGLMSSKYPVTHPRPFMYDSTDANDIPATANKMAGDVNGKYPSYYKMVKLSPQYRFFEFDVLGGACLPPPFLDKKKETPPYRN